MSRKCSYLLTFLLFFLLLSMTSNCFATEKILLGFNLPLSGPREATGISTKEGAELLKEQINKQGGLQIGNKSYPVEFVYVDNQSTASGAVESSLNLITKQHVLGIVGPNASSNAIPAGGICQSFETPMISPTSTNPMTTLNRPFVFRACFLDNFQGEVMANFATTELNAKKAAVLYNIASAYPKGLAEFFKTAFEQKAGEGSVVAFENFLTNETDLRGYLKRIVQSDADVLFLPQYSHEIGEIIKQAREVGWDKPILGGDAWESTDLMPTCGDLCKGMYFSSHFGAIGAKGITKTFVDQYKQTYKDQLPTGYSALGYDSASLFLEALKKSGNIEGKDLLETRQAIAKSLVEIKGFKGVSGTLDMNAAGDPSKSAVVIKINDNGEFEAFKTETPSL